MCVPGTCVICLSRLKEVEFEDPYPEIEAEEDSPAATFVGEEERMRIVEHLFRSDPHTWSTVRALAVIAAGRKMSDDEVEDIAKSLRIRVVRPVLDGDLVDEITLQMGATLTGTRLPS